MIEDQKHSWFVYVDRTADTNEPFYVGKGLIVRLLQEKRNNRKHANIVNKHGLKHTIVYQASSNDIARCIEIAVIKQLRTYAHSDDAVRLACNWTKGGDTTSGWVPSEETRRKIGAAQKGKPRKLHTEETKRKMSASAKRRIRRPFSEQAKKNMSAAHRRDRYACSNCRKQGHYRTTCPEKPVIGAD